MYEKFIENQIFLVMKFDGMDELFETIKTVGLKLGYDIKRADEGVGSVVLTDHIVQLIEESEFMIVDLTHDSPNVYFELGYAYGVGNESHDVLLIAHEASRGKIPFDVGNRRIVFYEDYAYLKNELLSGLPDMIKYARQKY
jgi:hypothetical protein